MNEKKYAVGDDFGILSGRGVLVDVIDSSEVTVAVFDNPKGIIDQTVLGNC